MQTSSCTSTAQAAENEIEINAQKHTKLSDVIQEEIQQLQNVGSLDATQHLSRLD
jgi:hypothetical protein